MTSLPVGQVIISETGASYCQIYNILIPWAGCQKHSRRILTMFSALPMV